MERLKNFLKSDGFDRFIFVVILVNAVVLGLQTVPWLGDSVRCALDIVDKVCLGIFVVEMLLKWVAFRLGYFRSGWNWFDFVIVVGSLLSEFPVLSSVRILRLFRIFRCLKIISNLKQLQVIIGAVGKALPGIGWTFLLLLVVYYMFAIIGVTMFGAVSPEHFGNIGSAFFTLFQLMTLDGWASEVARPVMDAQPWSWVYFVSFVLLSAVVMLNVVVGIVVDSINEINIGKRMASPGLRELEEIRKNLDAIEKMLKK